MVSLVNALYAVNTNRKVITRLSVILLDDR